MRISLVSSSGLEQLVAMEAEATPFPWSKDALERSLEQKHTIFQLKSGNRYYGYAVFMTVIDEAELLNLVIAKTVQGNGWGAWFLSQLFKRDELIGMDKTHLEVRASNTAAIRLYEKLGFVHNGYRKAYYPVESGLRENALMMLRTIG